MSLAGTVAKPQTAAASQKCELGRIQVFFICLFLQLGTVDDDSLEEYYSKSVSLNKQQCQVLLRLTLRRTGCFRTRISYKDQLLSNGEFDIIVLNGERPLRTAPRHTVISFHAEYAKMQLSVSSCCRE